MNEQYDSEHCVAQVTQMAGLKLEMQIPCQTDKGSELKGKGEGQIK